MLKLRFSNNPKQALWLVEPRLLIGSGAGCDLLLNEAGIAQRHAEIVVQHEKLTFRLLAESAITRVNGRSVKPGVALELKVDDLLGFGAVELQVIDPKLERVAAPAAADRSGWALKANHSALANRVYPLSHELVVGRSKECDIVLAAAHLSRRHAQFSIRDDKLYVKDLGSSNGTFLNGDRVTEARVKRGDELRFDTLSFGVIGPTDALDKTSIRAVPSSFAGAASAVIAPQGEVSITPARDPAVVTRVTRGPKQANTGVPMTASVARPERPGAATARTTAVTPVAATLAATNSAATNSAATTRAALQIEGHEPSAGRRVALGLGLLVIISGGLYFAWQNNWWSG